MPLKLYRDLFRLHRKLPDSLKQLGDTYIKQEFRLHRNASPTHAKIFMEKWSMYKNTLEAQQENFGENIDYTSNNFSKEQKDKLEQLKKTIK
jgi:hypothetical protein